MQACKVKNASLYYPHEAARKWEVLRKPILHGPHKSGDCVKQTILSPTFENYDSHTQKRGALNRQSYAGYKRVGLKSQHLCLRVQDSTSF